MIAFMLLVRTLTNNKMNNWDLQVDFTQQEMTVQSCIRKKLYKLKNASVAMEI